MKKELNWAGNFQYGTSNIHYPETISDIQGIVKRHNKIKVLGTRHSFNNIADSKDNFISLQSISPSIQVDKLKRVVTVNAGLRYGQLCGELHREGFALPNLGSLPHISIAGACATGTHGSGIKNSILATAVSALEFIDARGELITLTKEKDKEKFFGSVVNLGALGVVTKLTLDISPSFEVTQHIYEQLPLTALYNNLDEIFAMGYSVSAFTDWRSDFLNQIWIKHKVDNNSAEKKFESHLFGAKAATENLHPVPGMAIENCTQQMGIAGPWHERLPHFKMEFTPSSGEELQSEYFVPFEHALNAIKAINEIRELIAPQLQISELRTIDGDQLWMSPCYNRPSLAIHFTWHQRWDKVRGILPSIERQLTPFDVRPHWGKLFTMAPSQIRAQYEKYLPFKQLVNAYDPQGKFRNEYLEKYILAD